MPTCELSRNQNSHEVMHSNEFTCSTTSCCRIVSLPAMLNSLQGCMQCPNLPTAFGSTQSGASERRCISKTYTLDLRSTSRQLLQRKTAISKNKTSCVLGTTLVRLEAASLLHMNAIDQLRPCKREHISFGCTLPALPTPCRSYI